MISQGKLSNLLPKNLLNWKKQFLDNASLAFDKSAVAKEYKDEIEALQKDKDNMVKKVGELTLEKDFIILYAFVLLSNIQTKDQLENISHFYLICLFEVNFLLLFLG